MSEQAPTTSSETAATPPDLVDALRRENLQIADERDRYKQLSELLQKELERLRDGQKTPREHVDSDLAQLAFEQMVSALLATSAPPDPATPPPAPPSKPEQKPRKHTPHGRSILPDHLPVQTLVLEPEGAAPEGTVIGEEVTWRLGFKRGGFYRLKIVRPVFVIARAVAATLDTNAVNAAQHDGDYSPMVEAAATTAPATLAAAIVAAAELEPEIAAASIAEGASVVDGAATIDAVTAIASTRINGAGTVGAAAEIAAGAVEGGGACTSGSLHDGDSAPAQQDPSADPSAGRTTADDPPDPGSDPRPRDRDTTIVCAEPPHEIIPRGLPLPDLLAKVVVAKFADKLPLRRQEGIYARERIALSAATMCGWLEAGHGLASPLVAAMDTHARLHAHFIGTDSTGVLVQANQRCKRGHFWVLVADHDHVLFRYSKRCSSEEPKTFLQGFRGTVIADALAVYDALFGLPDGPTEGGCNSHARRYFYKALTSDRERALIAIGYFNELFRLERNFKKLSPADRLRMRQEQSRPVAEQFERWRTAELAHPAVADGTPIRRALNYTLNHWKALTRFLHDGKIPIHNNRSELELRRLVIGRANWLFVGSDDTAQWTCTFVSLIASCALHGLDPEAYLRDLFRVLPGWPKPRLLELAPKFWAASRARLSDTELALPLGPITVPPHLADVPPPDQAAK